MASLLLRSLGAYKLALPRTASIVAAGRLPTPLHLQQQQPQQRRWASGNQQATDLPRGPAQPSFRLQATENSEMMLRDVGILPYTFVPPSRQNLPSPFKETKTFFKLLQKRIKYKWMNLLYMVIYRYYSKGPLELKRPKGMAVPMYKTMYTAFAENNSGLLRHLCCDGLYENFKSRMQTRKTGPMRWDMHQLVDRPRVVSQNALYFPDLDLGFRQAVVRIKSTQSIARFDKNRVLIPGTGTPLTVTEYLVLQKRRTKGRDGEWMVWGTMEEANLETLEHREKNSMFMQQ